MTPHTDAGALLKLADEIEAYLDDAPMYGGHSDKAGASSWELLREAMEELRQAASHGREGGERSEVRTASAQVDPMDITQPVRSGLARAEAGEESGLDLEDIAKLLDAYDRLVLGVAQAPIETAFLNLCEALGLQATPLAYLDVASARAAIAPAQASVGPGAIERMVTAAMDTARLDAIEECAKVAEFRFAGSNLNNIGGLVAQSIRALAIPSAHCEGGK